MVTEKQFTQQVIDAARYMGYMVYHTWRSFHSVAGFPDLLMIREHRVIVAELKSARGIVTEQQKVWLDAFALAGVETYIWYPDNWEDLVEVLRGG